MAAAVGFAIASAGATPMMRIIIIQVGDVPEGETVVARAAHHVRVVQPHAVEYPVGVRVVAREHRLHVRQPVHGQIVDCIDYNTHS